jgi:GrpB-like predicted nucleotidyltransferase (UPF0157 family)
MWAPRQCRVSRPSRSWTSSSRSRPSTRARRTIEPLEQLGYLFVPEPASPDFDLFAKPPERPRLHHLHVCEARSAHELRHLAVRDFLRAHDDELAQYAALKRGVAARHPQDRLAYIAGKDEYVAGLEVRALVWLRGRRA